MIKGNQHDSLFLCFERDASDEHFTFFKGKSGDSLTSTEWQGETDFLIVEAAADFLFLQLHCQPVSLCIICSYLFLFQYGDSVIFSDQSQAVIP